MKTKFLSFIYLPFLLVAFSVNAQESMYGDEVKADVKMDYVYTLEDAFSKAKKTGKPIFFNCFADWAMPCHAMNKLVFSDQEFCDFMNNNFVNLFMDLSKGPNKPIAESYGVSSFAHFLVLDADNNVLVEIDRGLPKEEMREAVSLALNPKTTLPAAEKAYNDGKRGKKELHAYLTLLELNGDREKFKEVNREYFEKLSPKEYTKPENWLTVTSVVEDHNSPLFSTIVKDREKYIKANGEQKYNNFIESKYYWDVFNYAMGKTEYNPVALANLYRGLLDTGLPEDDILFDFYKIAKMRGEGDIDGMLAYLRDNSKKLGHAKFYVDNSLEFKDAMDWPEERRANLVSYLNEAADKLGRSSAAGQLREMADNLSKPQTGIVFEQLTYDEALAKAASENKLVFMDCYTTWCAPCKKLAKTVFTDEEVGAICNKNFINIKMDMESAEGRKLAEKYGVNAFPTLIFFDSTGKEAGRQRGFIPVEPFKKLVTSMAEKGEK